MSDTTNMAVTQTKYISKTDSASLASKLDGYSVQGPAEESGVYRFAPVREGGPALVYPNTQKPPKDLIFPQTEVMFDMVRQGMKFSGIDERAVGDGKVLMLGARPCDARSFAILDPVFNWDFKDKYYNQRRANTTIVSLACTGAAGTKPDGDCFCTSVGGAPDDPTGSDMLWTDVGDGYLVESFTDKGDALMAAGGSIFSEPPAGASEKAAEAKSASRAKLSRQVDTDGMDAALDGMFDEAFWDQFSKRCLGCGICTLLCPTCHCFDINDVIADGEGRRERTWDSCQFACYTLHASGHNPRPGKKHRQRNRVFHKFHYMKRNLEVVGCVGCGRCISKCPVNIDIVDVLQGVKDAAGNNGGGN